MKKLATFILAFVASVSIFATEGALSGKFTINAQGDQIVFSQGNLQYQASTQTWRFATNQYDYVGDDTNGNVYIGDSKSDNSLISDTYDGWIDLFGWGTGNAPTKTSTDDADYTDFTDWGTNPINNGGEETWRTPNKYEWVYLFSMRENAETLFGLGCINGVNGTILLPDNWELPEGASFTASTNFSENTYTTEQWSIMEAAGAVFLPAAGYREGKGVNLAGSYGPYWSATPKGTNFACFLDLNASMLSWQGYTSRHTGLSVRLVSDLVNTTSLSETIGVATDYYDEIKDMEGAEEIAAALLTAIEAAQTVLNNADATQAEVDAAVEALYAAVDQAQAAVLKLDVENVGVTNAVSKTFRDGVLLIEKNGKFYNATGAEVK